MGFLQYIRSDELDIIRALPTDSQCGRLLSALRERVRNNTSEAKLVQSGDTQEWYHLIWERFADAAFTYALDRDARLGCWLHDRTLEVCRKPLDEWVGPWFRKRANPPVGMLESAHITNAVCEVIGLAPELFSEAETDEIRSALRGQGVIALRTVHQRQDRQQLVLRTAERLHDRVGDARTARQCRARGRAVQ